MIVTPLAIHSPRAVRDTLRARGWDQANQTRRPRNAGLGPCAFRTGRRHACSRPWSARRPSSGSTSSPVTTGPCWPAPMPASARWPDPGSCRRNWPRYRTRAGPAHAGTGRAVAHRPRPHPAGSAGHRRHPQSHSRPLQRRRPVRWQPDAALAQAERLLAEGAAMLDLGGESTRPGERTGAERGGAAPRSSGGRGAGPPPPDAPLLGRYREGARWPGRRSRPAPRSSMTCPPSGSMPRWRGVVAGPGRGAILMHSRGTRQTMARLDHAEYAPDVVSGVRDRIGARRSIAPSTPEWRRTRSCSTRDSASPRPPSRICALLDGLPSAARRWAARSWSALRASVSSAVLTGRDVARARRGHGGRLCAGLRARRPALPGARRRDDPGCAGRGARRPGCWKVPNAARARPGTVPATFHTHHSAP